MVGRGGSEVACGIVRRGERVEGKGCREFCDVGGGGGVKRVVAGNNGMEMRVWALAEGVCERNWSFVEGWGDVAVSVFYGCFAPRVCVR